MAVEGLSLAANRPDNLTGVISFKLHLDEGVQETAVTVYFSEPAPDDAMWYKYDPDSGWTAYPEAVFSSDRRSVRLDLEDGGAGDLDGVVNGVIVDPAGLGYSSSQTTDTSGSFVPSDGASGGCFVTTAMDSHANANGTPEAMLLLIALVAVAGLGKGLRRRLRGRR